MEVERLLSLKANKKMVKDKLEQMSGKIFTQQSKVIKILGMT